MEHHHHNRLIVRLLSLQRMNGVLILKSVWISVWRSTIKSVCFALRQVWKTTTRQPFYCWSHYVCDTLPVCFFCISWFLIRCNVIEPNLFSHRHCIQQPNGVMRMQMNIAEKKKHSNTRTSFTYMRTHWFMHHMFYHCQQNRQFSLSLYAQINEAILTYCHDSKYAHISNTFSYTI